MPQRNMTKIQFEAALHELQQALQLLTAWKNNAKQVPLEKWKWKQEFY